MNIATARKVKLNRVAPGYYCWQNFNTGHAFEIIRNELGMWRVTHTDPTDTESTTLAETLDDARALIAAATARA